MSGPGRGIARLLVAVLTLAALLLLVNCNDAEPQPVVSDAPAVAPAAAAPRPTSAPTSAPAATVPPPTPAPASAPAATPPPTSPPPAAPLGEESITAAAGGVVSIGPAEDSPLTLEIPPGALAADTTISITESPPSEWSDGMKALEPVGAVYRLEPDGLVLAEPATITLKLDETDLSGIDLERGVPAMVLLTRSADGGWEILPEPATSIDLPTGTLTVTATISHFTEATLQKTDISVTMDPLEVKEPKGATFEPAVTATNASAAGGAYGTFIYTATGAVAVNGDFRSFEAAVGPGETTGPFPEPVYECTEVGPGTYEARFVWTADSEEIDWVRALLTLGESVSAGPISGTAAATGSADCVAPATASGVSEGTTAESVEGGTTESVDTDGDATESPTSDDTPTPTPAEPDDGATEGVTVLDTPDPAGDATTCGTDTPVVDAPNVDIRNVMILDFGDDGFQIIVTLAGSAGDAFANDFSWAAVLRRLHGDGTVSAMIHEIHDEATRSGFFNPANGEVVPDTADAVAVDGSNLVFKSSEPLTDFAAFFVQAFNMLTPDSDKACDEVGPVDVPSNGLDTFAEPPPDGQATLTCSAANPDGLFVFPIRCDLFNPGPEQTFNLSAEVTDGDATVFLGRDHVVVAGGVTESFRPMALVNILIPNTFEIRATGEDGAAAINPSVLTIPPQSGTSAPDSGPNVLGGSDSPNDTFYSGPDASQSLADPRVDILGQGALIFNTDGSYPAGAGLIAPDGPFACGAPNDYGFHVVCNDETGSDLSTSSRVVLAYTCTGAPLPVSGDDYLTVWFLLDDGDPTNDFVVVDAYPNDPLGGTDQHYWLDYDPFEQRLYITQSTGPMLIDAPTNARGFIAGSCAGFVIPDSEVDVDSFISFATFLGQGDDPFGPSATLDRSPDPGVSLPMATECPIFADGFESGDLSAWSSSCP